MQRGIVHCDLKCDNILLATPDEDATVKIADFGFAQLVPRSTKLSEPCGTPE
jgi:calcium/calmodulin-dependent protein kinase I